MSVEPITKPYRVASGEGLADVWWKTGRMTVKASGAETGDAFSQIEIDSPRGDATPRHLHHNEDETYYVLEGEVTLFVGDERIDLHAGDFCFAPAAFPTFPSFGPSVRATSRRSARPGSSSCSSSWEYRPPTISRRPTP